MPRLVHNSLIVSPTEKENSFRERNASIGEFEIQTLAMALQEPRVFEVGKKAAEPLTNTCVVRITVEVIESIDIEIRGDKFCHASNNRVR